MDDEVERVPDQQDLEEVSMEEIDAEGATSASDLRLDVAF